MTQLCDFVIQDRRQSSTVSDGRNNMEYKRRRRRLAGLQTAQIYSSVSTSCLGWNDATRHHLSCLDLAQISNRVANTNDNYCLVHFRLVWYQKRHQAIHGRLPRQLQSQSASPSIEEPQSTQSWDGTHSMLRSRFSRQPIYIRPLQGQEQPSASLTGGLWEHEPSTALIP